MKFKLGLSFIVLTFFVLANYAQTDIQIKKKTSRQIPGMPTEGLTPEMAAQLKKINETTTTVYIRNSQMRTDTTANLPKMTGGGFDTHTFSSVIQCDKRRVVNFDTKSKKYYQYSMTEKSSATGKGGGKITVSGNITDTGERAKVFGYDARRLKQTYTFTPSGNSCMKEKMQVNVDGWYAEMPEFSCPMKMALPEKMDGGDCIDDYDFQVSGALTGVALKEVKKITFSGQTITMEEEAAAINKTTLPANFFEPPVGYKSGNQFSSSPSNTAQNGNTSPNITSLSTTSDSLPPPAAGMEKQPIGDKKAGMIRVGIAIPKVTTPDSKKDPNAGTDIGIAVTKSLLEMLKAENVEAVELTSESPESECREKGCDYIFYANVMQKRGGGMFKSMILQGAIMGAGMMVPGVGGMIASSAGSVLMGQTMGKESKAKDEFTLDYKVTAMDNSVFSKAVTKKKTEKDGEDVLTAQLQEASKTVLGEIAKKGK
jgi:hypothetical protein